jgi:hypothetical protein
MGKLIADRAYQRLLDLVASIDFRARAGPPARRPRSCCSVRPLALIVWDLNRETSAAQSSLTHCGSGRL